MGTLEAEKIGIGHFAVFLPFLSPSLLLHRETVTQRIGYVSDRRCEKPKQEWWSNPEISRNKMQVVLNGEKQVGGGSWRPGAQVTRGELDFTEKIES